MRQRLFLCSQAWNTRHQLTCGSGWLSSIRGLDCVPLVPNLLPVPGLVRRSSSVVCFLCGLSKEAGEVGRMQKAAGWAQVCLHGSLSRTQKLYAFWVVYHLHLWSVCFKAYRSFLYSLPTLRSIRWKSDIFDQAKIFKDWNSKSRWSRQKQGEQSVVIGFRQNMLAGLENLGGNNHNHFGNRPEIPTKTKTTPPSLNVVLIFRYFRYYRNI